MAEQTIWLRALRRGILDTLYGFSDPGDDTDLSDIADRIIEDAMVIPTSVTGSAHRIPDMDYARLTPSDHEYWHTVANDFKHVANDFQQAMFREQKRCERAQLLLRNWLADTDVVAAPLEKLQSDTRDWLAAA